MAGRLTAWWRSIRTLVGAGLRAAARAVLPAPRSMAAAGLLTAGALGATLREPVPRTMLDWAPADLRRAMQWADGGNLTRAADLCDAILTDDRAPSVIRTRVLALTGSDLSFEAAPSGRLRRRALRAAQAEEDWWAMLP